jgi:outer membrane immunogenic protein
VGDPTLQSDIRYIGPLCIGGAVVNISRVWAVALLTLGAFGALGRVDADADEMTSPPAAVITAPASSLQWTGFYIGGNGGYGWSSSSVAYTPNDAAASAGTCGGVGHGKCIPGQDFLTRGPLAGGQIGFNWQINGLWLVGVETDYQWASLTGTATSSFSLGNVGNTTMVADQSIKSFGTTRIRMGVILSNPLLLYGTGGLAYGQVSENFKVGNPVSAGSDSLASGGFSYVCSAGNPACFAGASSKTMIGWTVGGGAEYALTNNLIFKSEILYVNLGVPAGTVVAQGAAAGTTPSSFAANLSPAGFIVARGGLDFKF